VVSVVDVWPSVRDQVDVEPRRGSTELPIFAFSHRAAGKLLEFPEGDALLQRGARDQRAGPEAPDAETLPIDEGFAELGLGPAATGQAVGVDEPDLGTRVLDLRGTVLIPAPLRPVDP